ncbi:MAG: fluoride efflux transporter CrcB [Alphaproteobacteria bacterium]|nr:fluoride efflux transporter CrcB [Alphaproteobacteria bacterium]HCP01434.1 fluoride efflux transporter CrcB [Rhodospirillaceae bacterium]
MNILFAIAVGGAAGALGRHFVNVGIAASFGLGIPWGTFVVNVCGSFVMGMLVHVMSTAWTVSPELRALLTVGGLGAFTTFSTFSLDAVALYERGQVMFAAVYVLASVVGAIGALLIGLRLARLVFT